jgi:ssDNA-binding Zn-finger/Zn-ribbon topoisomerase 1
MARERYNISTKCPKCGQEGVLRISENDYPFMRRLDRNISCVSGEFGTFMVNDFDAQITCYKCNHVYKW